MAHQKYGKLLSIQGRFKEAVAQCSLAKQLDLWSARASVSLAWTLFDAHEYGKTREYIQT
jgi:hypothetical protein